MMNIKMQSGLILVMLLWTIGFLLNVQAESYGDLTNAHQLLYGARFFDKNIDLEDSGPVINPVPHQKHRRFIPFARPLRIGNSNSSNNKCPSSEDDFPYFLSDDTVKKGGFILCVLIGVYCFTLLAVVCGNYFLPCVETICEILNLSPDVAAATFMSVATSCPELFTNIIATFVTDSDLGIGTIVGSSLFNGLGVAAIGGLAAPVPLQLDWWPLTRDCCLYICSVIALVIITWDGVIQWYEALVLVIIYVLYFIIIFQSDRLERIIKSCIGKPDDDEPVPKSSIISAYGSYAEETNPVQHQQTLEKIDEEDKKAAQRSLFRKPEGRKLKKFLFYYTWPLQFLMSITIPNPKLHPRLFPLTFIMCIIWIGCNAYVVSWMISIIGNQLNLPDAVLGMTFLAAGGCLPESISMTIISRRGEGAFGVSNSLGANSMNILLSLGMPWFFKTIINGANNSSAIHIESGSIEYTILALIFVSISLYSTLAINKFRLGKVAGGILLCVYVIMVVLAILSEMLFFDNKKC